MKRSGDATGPRRKRRATAGHVSGASMVNRSFRGIFAPTVTPLDHNGDIVLSAIEPYAKLLADDGCNGVFVLGTAGGSMHYSVEERKALTKEWCRVGPKYGLEVIAHIGAQSQEDCKELAREAAADGAVGISAMTPCFFRPSSVDTLADFIAPIAAAAPNLPFLYYHFPDITAVTFPFAAVMKALHKRVPTLRGGKFTSTNIWDLGDTLDYMRKVGAKWHIFNGFDGMTTSAVPLGIHCHIGIGCNVVAPVWNRMVRAAEAGDAEAAEREQVLGREWFRLFAEISGLWSMGAATKLILGWRLGMNLGPARSPQTSLSPEHEAKLKKAWDEWLRANPGLLSNPGKITGPSPMKVAIGGAPAPAAHRDLSTLPGLRGELHEKIRARVREVSKKLGGEPTYEELMSALPHLHKGPRMLAHVGPADFPDLIDHTLLKADATTKDITKLCEEAKMHDFRAVCVNAGRVAECAQQLDGTGTLVAAVVGFPLGATNSTTKRIEAVSAVEAGAQEIDMVINVGALLQGDYQTVLTDIEAVVDGVRGRAAIMPDDEDEEEEEEEEEDEEDAPIVKVILETCLLSDEQIIDACIISVIAGAHFVKTSTGFSKSGATLEVVDLMKTVVGDACSVKASGGVRDAAALKNFAAIGAERIGTSSGVAIVSGHQAGGGY